MSGNEVIGRLKRYPVAVVSGLVVLVCLVAFFLRGGILNELNMREDELNSRLRVIEKNVKNSKGIEEDVEVVRAQVEEVDSRLFNREERAINTDFFYDFEDRVDVLVSSVMQLPGEDPALGKGGPKALSEHASLVYTVEVSGSFANLLKLLYEFHAAEPFIRVADFEIGRGSRTATNDLRAILRVLVLAENDE